MNDKTSPPHDPAPAATSAAAPVTPALPADTTSSPASEASSAFPRAPGETPRAYSAFLAFLQLPHPRPLQLLAEKLGESTGTIKNWSSKFDWNARLQTFNSSLLQQHSSDCADRYRQHTANWATRLEQLREQEWEVSQKLRQAALCYLESFGDDELRRMTLAQVSRALRIASSMARAALTGLEVPPSSEAELAPLQQQLLEAMQRVYPQSDAPPAPPGPAAGATALPLTDVL